MPKTVVTGASGKVGWWTVRSLAEAGHDILAVDRVAPNEPLPRGVKFWPAELTDLGEVFQCLAGADYVCHIAAIPSPSGFPEATTYRNNTISTFNVFQAAVDSRVTKVAYTSSETVYGFIGGQRLKPARIPVNEEHPTAPQGAYALSKKLGEEMADMFCRNHETAFASFRLANVRSPGNYDVYPERRKRADTQASGLWSYVDARDVGQACVRFWASDLTGHTVFNLSAADNWLDEDVRSVVARSSYADVELDAGFEGDATGWDISRARELLGYRPEHSWRQNLSS